MTVSHIAGPIHQQRSGRNGLRRRGVEAMPLHAPSETYRFVAPRRGRALLNALLLVAVGFTALGAFVSATAPSGEAVAVTGVSAGLVVALWSAMKARLPKTITLNNSVIEIRSNGSVERFDLVDPSVEVLARDGEMAFRCYDGRFAVVRSRDVDWKEFTHVVMHYQNHADRKAEERKSRFTR